MAQHIDQAVSTVTNLADGDSLEIVVNTDTADRVSIFVDDGVGGSPPSYDLSIDVAYNDGDEGTFMPRSEVSSVTSTNLSYTDVSPFTWRITVTNSSGGPDDYRVRAVTIEDGE